MKKLILALAASIIPVTMSLVSCGDKSDEPDNKPQPQPVKTWVEVWSDDFNGTELDATVWSRTTRGSSDWNNNQSDDPRLVILRDGCVVVRGIVNDNTASDPQQYICGGIWSKDKMAFGSTQNPTSIQVRARLGKGAQGAWPAIWMMPFKSTEGWPACGEIDIMERLNHENSFYSTVHSYYTYTLGIKDPANSRYTSFNPNEFHVFEVQLWPDRVEYYLDYARIFSYPKVNDGKDNQFPFFKQWHLIMDMQVGGSWVGSVAPSQLPVEMEIDWVKYQEFKEVVQE